MTTLDAAPKPSIFRKAAVAIGAVALKVVASVAIATATAVMGFVLAAVPAYLIPGAFFFAPLAVAKIGATVALVTRIFVEAK